MTPVLAPTRLPRSNRPPGIPPPATLSSANTYMQRISSTKPSCETRKHSQADQRRPVTCTNSTGVRPGMRAGRPTRRGQPHAHQGSELWKYREVELSGLEPLTSCMPCRAISSARIPGSLVPARQAKCSVWLGPVLTARVWGRSHLVCHWLSVPHQGGETPDKQRQHRQPHTLPHQRPVDRTIKRSEPNLTAHSRAAASASGLGAAGAGELPWCGGRASGWGDDAAHPGARVPEVPRD
jgi:hypothetical protein